MRLEFKKSLIDHIITKDEQVFWYNSYKTNLFRIGLSELYGGLFMAIFIIIFGIFFTIQFGFLYLVFFIFAFPVIFIALRGFIKIVSIKNKLISIPDDPRQYNEVCIFTNKRWIQKSSICMGVKPNKNLRYNHPNTLYESFNDVITEYKS